MTPRIAGRGTGPVHLIAGLGNPGRRYGGTRHNAGFRVIEALSRHFSAGRPFRRAHSLCAEVRRPAGKIVLAQPLTYMNLSGRAVVELWRYYSVGPDCFLLIHDDLDLSLGILRLKRGGGSAGHRGVQSVAEHLGSTCFDRLRFGIGRPVGMEAAGYVLAPFASGEKELLDETVERAVQAVLMWVEEGFDPAANRFNRTQA